VFTFILILLCAKGIDSLKITKQETIYSLFFYRVLFGFMDFFFNIAFNPLGISLFLFIINFLFIFSYGFLYYQELISDSKEGDTGSSTGPRPLKNHPLIHFVKTCS